MLPGKQGLNYGVHGKVVNRLIGSMPPLIQLNPVNNSNAVFGLIFLKILLVSHYRCLNLDAEPKLRCENYFDFSVSGRLFF